MGYLGDNAAYLWGIVYDMWVALICIDSAKSSGSSPEIYRNFTSTLNKNNLYCCQFARHLNNFDTQSTQFCNSEHTFLSASWCLPEATAAGLKHPLFAFASHTCRGCASAQLQEPVQWFGNQIKTFDCLPELLSSVTERWRAGAQTRNLVITLFEHLDCQWLAIDKHEKLPLENVALMD